MLVYSIAIKLEKRGPMVPVRNAFVTVMDGIIGDCRGVGGLTHSRQVTLISYEQWLDACSEIGVRLPAYARRANVCVRGHMFGSVDLGKELIFSTGLILQITGETKPCSRMDEVYPRLQEALKPNWRGGVTCRVIAEGGLNIDDEIKIQ